MLPYDMWSAPPLKNCLTRLRSWQLFYGTSSAQAWQLLLSPTSWWLATQPGCVCRPCFWCWHIFDGSFVIFILLARCFHLDGADGCLCFWCSHIFCFQLDGADDVQPGQRERCHWKDPGIWQLATGRCWHHQHHHGSDVFSLFHWCHYLSYLKEAAWETPTEFTPPLDWPNRGEVLIIIITIVTLSPSVIL